MRRIAGNRLGVRWRLAAFFCGLSVACAEQTTATDPNALWKVSHQIYGFAMLDAGCDFKQAHPDWFDVVRPTKLPSKKNEFGADGNTYFSVRQTRFGD